MIAINFQLLSSKGTDEECLMRSKSDNMEIMINYRAGEVIKIFFKSLISRYQRGLEVSMEGRHFIFDYFDLPHHERHKLNSNHDASYKDSPNQIKKRYNKP